MKINFIVIISFLFFLTSCHKDNENADSRHFIDSRLTGNEFKPGSYWIYLNDSTQKTDCTYVFKVESGYNEWYDTPYNGKRSLYEYFDVFYHDKDSMNLNYYDRDRISLSYIYRHTIADDSIHFGGTLIYYFEEPGYLIRVFIDTIEHIKTLQVLNYSFNNVQKAIIDSNYSCFYTVRSLGVVRKVIHNSYHQGTWNLLRWKINN